MIIKEQINNFFGEKKRKCRCNVIIQITELQNFPITGVRNGKEKEK